MFNYLWEKKIEIFLMVLMVLTYLKTNNFELNDQIETLNEELKYQSLQIDKQSEEIAVLNKLTINPEKIINWIHKNGQLNEYKSEEIGNYILENCEYPIFTIALMQRESSFNPFAKSRVGAKGLGQIMWSIWSSVLIEEKIATEEKDLYDWKINIQATDFILKNFYKIHEGNWQKILTHYVGGNQPKYISDVFKNIGEIYMGIS